MDVDEFLDRELSELGLDTDKNERQGIVELPQHKEYIEPSPLFENIKSNLSKGNLEQAEHSYVQLWGILTQQKLKWNNQLYEQLFVLTKQFSVALDYTYSEVKKKSARINELINQAKDYLRAGKKELSFKCYSEIQNTYNSIPKVFFEEKRILEEQIMNFYKELNTTTDNELIRRVSSLTQEINKLIEKISASLRSNNITDAIADYNKFVELYNQVPEGFLRYKNAAGMRLLEIYKSLSIYAEISNLQKQLSQQQSQQSQVRQQPRAVPAAPPAKSAQIQ